MLEKGQTHVSHVDVIHYNYPTYKGGWKIALAIICSHMSETVHNHSHDIIKYLSFTVFKCQALFYLQQFS